MIDKKTPARNAEVTPLDSARDGRWQGANLPKDTRICLLIEEGGEVGW
jgi:hypothetical protein